MSRNVRVVTVSTDGTLSVIWIRFWLGLLRIPLIGESACVFGGGWLKKFIFTVAKKLIRVWVS